MINWMFDIIAKADVIRYENIVRNEDARKKVLEQDGKLRVVQNPEGKWEIEEARAFFGSLYFPPSIEWLPMSVRWLSTSPHLVDRQRADLWDLQMATEHLRAAAKAGEGWKAPPSDFISSWDSLEDAKGVITQVMAARRRGDLEAEERRKAREAEKARRDATAVYL